jgi:hypothetical protein
VRKQHVIIGFGAAAWLGAAAAWAADRYAAFNSTTGTTFSGLYLAPAGTTSWGPNQTVNDHDHTLEPSERLKLTGLEHRRYDVRLVDTKGRTCLKPDVDLTHETSFEIKEADLASCR